MRLVFLDLLTVALQSGSAREQVFTGVIAESECADGNHSRMRMGATDAECAVACVESHGAAYLLYDGTASYGLSDQKASAKFAAQKVTVRGTLATGSKTIQVRSITPAK